VVRFNLVIVILIVHFSIFFHVIEVATISTRSRGSIVLRRMTTVP
jgi:hypothetical protein